MLKGLLFNFLSPCLVQDLTYLVMYDYPHIITISIILEINCTEITPCHTPLTKKKTWAQKNFHKAHAPNNSMKNIHLKLRVFIMIILTKRIIYIITKKDTCISKSYLMCIGKATKGVHYLI